MEVSTDILEKIRPAVYDFYSVTARHFLNAGEALSIRHFHLLLIVLIGDINNISVDEVNTVHAAILFKGHSKDWLDHTELFQPVLLLLKLLTSSYVT